MKHPGSAAVIIQNAARARQARKTVEAVREEERLRGIVASNRMMHTEEWVRSGNLARESIPAEELIARLKLRQQSREAWSQFRWMFMYTVALLVSVMTIQAAHILA